jgi:hypothetical protein
MPELAPVTITRGLVVGITGWLAVGLWQENELLEVEDEVRGLLEGDEHVVWIT